MEISVLQTKQIPQLRVCTSRLDNFILIEDRNYLPLMLKLFQIASALQGHMQSFPPFPGSTILTVEVNEVLATLIGHVVNKFLNFSGFFFLH